MPIKNLKYLPFFSAVNSDTLAIFAEACSLKHFNKKDSLFLHGEQIRYCYIINCGWVKLYRNTFDGQEALVGLSQHRDLVGEIGLDNPSHSFSAAAITDIESLVVPYKIFIDCIEKDPKFSLNVIKALNHSASLLELQIEHGSTMNAAQRLCCFILRSTDLQHSSFKFTLPCDKNIIASYLGMKGETFSRALNELRAIGITIEGNNLSIANIKALMDFCCVSCSLVFDSCKNK